jgi:hypothetical protein
LSLQELESRDVPTFLGNQLFPLDNPWNQVIANAPVASNSAAIINRIIDRHVDSHGNFVPPPLHPDFGNPVTDGALYGIPVNIANSSTPRVTVTIPSFGYGDESDSVQVPIPANPVIEGDGPTGPSDPSNPGARGDSHLLVYDSSANVLYEMVSAARPNETQYPYGGAKPLGVWGAYQLSYWDLNTDSFRTVGETSADAAGLPILPGLVRPDEALPSPNGVGVIDHAIRMTVQQTADMFVFPASHEASSLSGSDLPRMGERFRLKASFQIPSNWAPETKAIAQAMKTYGMIVADNGSDMYFQGLPSSMWNMDSVLQIGAITASSFEVVDLTPRVTGLSTNTGSTAGGTQVTITGQNFSGAAGRLHVNFGTTPATSFQIVSDTQIIAVAPPHAAGAGNVTIQSGQNQTDNNGATVFFGYGTSTDTAADAFTFSATSPPPVSPPPPGSPPPPPLPTVSVNSVQANQGTGSSTLTFTVSLSAAASGSVTVQYATQPGTALAGTDYTSASGMLTFTAGQTSQPVTITVLGATAPEPNQTFNLVLSSPTGATVGTGTGVATLVDTVTSPPPPPPPLPTVSVNSVQANQGTGSSTLTFTVSLSAAASGSVTVQYATQPGTALAGTDYTSASGMLTFTAGQTSKTVSVTVLGATAPEPNQTFNLVLSNPSGATVGTGTGVATLVDTVTSPPPVSPPPVSPPPVSPPPGGTGHSHPGHPHAGPLAAMTFGSGLVLATDQSGGIVYAGRPFGSYAGGVRTAVGDLNGDGVNDLVVMAGPGPLSGLIVVYSGIDFSVLSVSFVLPGASNLMVADPTGAGYADIFVAPAKFPVFFVFSGRDNSFIGFGRADGTMV